MSWTVVAAFALGALGWSFLEYCFHRWLGHDSRFRPNIFEVEHTRHHSQGDYFAPNTRKALAAVAFLTAVAVPSVLVAGVAHGLAFAFGIAGFYLVYEVIHRRAHTHIGIGPYGRWLRRHHFWHHFGDPRVNHGVTSPLWDFVFGTFRRPGVIAVPRKLAMRWLLDPSTGDVRAEVADHYTLRGAARRVDASVDR